MFCVYGRQNPADLPGIRASLTCIDMHRRSGDMAPLGDMCFRNKGWKVIAGLCIGLAALFPVRHLGQLKQLHTSKMR